MAFNSLRGRELNTPIIPKWAEMQVQFHKYGNHVLLCWISFRKHKHTLSFFMFLDTGMAQVIELLTLGRHEPHGLVQERCNSSALAMELRLSCTSSLNLFIPNSKYHGCWWPGDTRSQGISSYCIDLVLRGYSSLNTRGIDIEVYYDILAYEASTKSVIKSIVSGGGQWGIVCCFRPVHHNQWLSQ